MYNNGPCIYFLLPNCLIEKADNSDTFSGVKYLHACIIALSLCLDDIKELIWQRNLLTKQIDELSHLKYSEKCVLYSYYHKEK